MIAIVLIVVFDASVTGLIPLYAIGVFLSFTLSQAGMTRRWWKSGRLAAGQEIAEAGSVLAPRPALAPEDGGQRRSARCSPRSSTVVFAVTKFHDGAWVVVIMIPTLVALFFAIHRHYLDAAQRLSLEDFGAPPRVARHRVILPISGVHRGHGGGAALRARPLRRHHGRARVDGRRRRRHAVEAKWGLWGNGVRLVILESPYRLLLEPLLDYIKDDGRPPPAERDDHDRGAAVRAAQVVAQAAARADGGACCAWPCSSGPASSSPACPTRWRRTSATGTRR